MFLRFSNVTSYKLKVGGWRVNLPPPPYFFSLNNSEMLKAATLVFRSILQHFLRDVRAKFGIPNLPQAPDMGQNSDGGISDFWISSQFLLKVNWHNSRTSDNIDMKPGPVTKPDKGNKTTSKKLLMTPCC